MKPTSRLFSCLLCFSQTVICSTCDRGQLYCSNACSAFARQQSCKRAGIRYQQTFKGKMNHALRQRRYRERLKQKVTHQGSITSTEDGLLLPVENKPEQSIEKQYDGPIKCSFCQNTVPLWLRSGFLGHSFLKKIPGLPYIRPP